MRNKEFVKKIDSVGRVTIPLFVRKCIETETGDDVCFEIKDDCVVMTKKDEKCLFCKAKEGLIEYKQKWFCHNCLDEIITLHK